MLFNSYEFLLFFPIVTLLYFLVPQKLRWIWLLVCSYFFYMCWNPTYVLLLAASTVITWLSGLLIGRAAKLEDEKKAVRLKKLWVALSFTLNLGILAFFKYSGFFAENVNALFGAIGISASLPKFDILLPVGISFYTFQALSYTADVYRKDIAPEKNIARYALFVSFFPQLVAGPIERSSALLPQMYEPHKYDSARTRRGLLLMGFGMFQKMVIADRIAIFVNAIYGGNLAIQPGASLLLATILFGIQIYCDFAGYSNIAIGAAQVLGFTLSDNFRRPYFAFSIRDFWRRWHISLSSWFRDYLYIPLGGSRKGKIRRYFNTMLTFVLSGLWHGANWTYIIWGALHGIYQVLGDVLKPVREWFMRVTHAKTDGLSIRLIRTGFTWLLVDFAWIFFRASSLSDALTVINRIFTSPQWWTLFDKSLENILPAAEFTVLFIALALLLVISILSVRTDLRTRIEQQSLWLRWCVYIGIIFAIVIFGVYGPDYVASEFIYFQF